jgi:WhiB family transcriptional regulator, redox-sensing transcriptional regulator
VITRSALAFSPGAAGPLLDGEHERDWRDQALCQYVDPDLWHPPKGGSTVQAKRICRSCPVRAECLEFALANNEPFGIWGGLSERERRSIRLGRARAALAA